jgi:hypothetical protein
VTDALEADQAVGNLLNVGAAAVQDNDLHAVVMVQVDMEGGDDLLVVLVLEVVESVGQLADVVVVNQGQSADHLGLGRGDVLANQAIADQVAEGFRPVGVTAAFDLPVKHLQ